MRLNKEVCRSCRLSKGWTWNDRMEYFWEKGRKIVCPHKVHGYTWPIDDGTIPVWCGFVLEHIMSQSEVEAVIR